MPGGGLGGGVEVRVRPVEEGLPALRQVRQVQAGAAHGVRQVQVQRGRSRRSRGRGGGGGGQAAAAAAAAAAGGGGGTLGNKVVVQ